MEFDGWVVVITGATGGLGRVVARTFAERGARLAVVSSDQTKLDALGRELGVPDGRWLAHAADLRQAAAAQAAAAAVATRFGHADIVVHLVGGWVGGKELAATDPDDLKAMLDQHVWTTFHLLQAFLPQLATSGRGRLLVVSSPVATRPVAKMGAYAAAKAAEEALILTAAQEARAQGVTANILQVRTIDVAHKREQDPAPSNASWTTPEEIAAAILYLCSPAGGMVSGVRLPLVGSGA